MSNLHEIGAIYDPEEAYVVFSFLTAYGFHPLLFNHEILAVQPDLRMALVGHRVIVPASESQEARFLLDDARRNPNKIAPDCEKCGANDFFREKALAFPLTLLGLAFSVAPIVPSTKRLRCRNCGHRTISD